MSRNEWLNKIRENRGDLISVISRDHPVNRLPSMTPNEVYLPITAPNAEAASVSIREDIARENWSKYEQETAPHALSGIQGQGGAGRRSRRQDARRAGATA